ncbi:MAG: tetratricopeptide repeat protein [Candidatus Eisenbacteria bacterium]
MTAGRSPQKAGPSTGKGNFSFMPRAFRDHGWMIAALIAAVLARVAGWLLLRGSFFTALPGFEDEVHAARIMGLLSGGFPEAALPAGSPIYPYVGALLGLLTRGSIPGILLLQALAGIGVVVLVAWSCAPLLPARLRWIAALLYAIHPVAVFLELRLQPVVFAFLLMLPALRLLFFTRNGALSRYAFGSLLLGAGFLLRPLIFAVLFAAAVIDTLRRLRLRPADPARTAAVLRVLPLMFAGFLLLPVLLSAYHATLPGGGPSWNWTDAYCFHRSLQPDTWSTARSSEIPVWEGYASARSQANEALGRETAEWEALTFYRGRGLQVLIERPIRWVGLVLLRGLLLLSRPELPDPVSARFVMQQSAGVLAWGLYLFPLYLGLAAVALFRSWRTTAIQRLAPALIALAAANVLGTYSLSSRFFFLVGLLPAAALTIGSLAEIARELGRRGPTRIAVAAAGVLLVFSALDPSGAQRRFEQPAEDLREAARLLRQNRDPRGATSLLRQALQVDPSNPAVHADLGELRAAEALLDAAREEFRAALDIHPDHVKALYGLAEIERSEGNYAEAESLMTRLVAGHPRHPLYLNQLASVQLLRGNLASAHDLLTRALTIAPNYQVAQANLRTVEEAQRRTSGMVLPEELSSKTDPLLIQLGVQAAQAMASGQLAAADTLTAAVMSKFPEDPMAWYMRGAFLLRAGRPAEALGPLQRLNLAAPGRAVTITMAAEALIALGRRGEAIALVRENIAHAPDVTNQGRLERLLAELQARP